MYQLLNKDLFEVEIPKCRLLLTDIPYGKVSREDAGLRNLDKSNADIINFDISDFLEHVWGSADIFVIFCGNEQYSEIYDWFNKKSSKKLGTTRQLIWSKTNPSPMNSEYVLMNATENAVWFKKRGTGKLPRHYIHNVYEAPTGSSKYHPTEKNHKLLEQIILDNTVAGDLIVDSCMGSGSTGLMALKNDREFVGIEIHKPYFEIAEERIGEIYHTQQSLNI